MVLLFVYIWANSADEPLLADKPADFSVPTFVELYKIAHFFNCFEKLRGRRSISV